MVVSDHSPCAPRLKGDGDFGRAFGGVSSLQLGPRAVWTHAAQRGFGLADLSRWMSERPAALAGWPTGDGSPSGCGQTSASSIRMPKTSSTPAHFGTGTRSARMTVWCCAVRCCRPGSAGRSVFDRVRAAGVKILVLNPNTSESMTGEIAAAARAAAAAGTEIVLHRTAFRRRRDRFRGRELSVGGRGDGRGRQACSTRANSTTTRWCWPGSVNTARTPCRRCCRYRCSTSPNARRTSHTSSDGGSRSSPRWPARSRRSKTG